MTVSSNGSITVAYVLLHFPYFTETFVADEIQAIQNLGVKVKILSLLGPGEGPVQPVSEELLSVVIYPPSIVSLKLWTSQLKYILRAPRRYFQTLLTLLQCPHSRMYMTSLAKRLVIFLKAVAFTDRFKDLHVDMLHTHFAWLSGAAVWTMAQFLELPYTVTVHAFDLFSSTDFVNLVCGEATSIVSISEYNKRHLSKVGIRSVEAISVIHCGVDLDRFVFLSPLERDRPLDSKLRILSVGNLVQKKGHQYLIRACKLLLEEGYSFECTIIGEGPLRNDLSRLIKSVGLQDHVRLIGARKHPEIDESYYNHDLFVLASEVAETGDQDGIPVVLMEASAAGLPIISTKISGIPEIVKDKSTGYLVTPGDVPAIARAILDLRSNVATRARLAKNAHNLIELEFDIKKNSKRLVALFDEIVSTSPKQQRRSTPP